MAQRRHMQRREVPLTSRFLTFSCYQRLPLLGSARIRDAFADHLEQAHRELDFRLQAWVIMPEHVHLLMMPALPATTVRAVMAKLKAPFAKRVVGRWRELKAPVLLKLIDKQGSVRFWQKGGGYDRNIFTPKEFTEKFNYIHWNPVRRGLVSEPREWKWSSAAWYAGDRSSLVSIDEPRSFAEWRTRVAGTERGGLEDSSTTAPDDAVT